MKETAIKDLNSVRKEILSSSYNDIPKIIMLSERALAISENAPLRMMKKHDGSSFTNSEERKLLMGFLVNRIKELPWVRENDFKYFKFQLISNIVMLMVSISDYGISELEMIINKQSESNA